MAVMSATSSENKTRHCQACERTAPDIKLFWCARCKQVSYCSKDCQTSNWKSHRASCKSQTSAQNGLHQIASAVPGTVERETYEVEMRLKRWIELYRGTVGTAAIHSLTLQSTPEKVLTHVLVITLSPNPAFWSSTTPRAISRCFQLTGLGVTTLEAVREQVAQADDKVAEEQINESFNTVLKQSHALREKGGVGSAITLIQVQSTRVLHITPFSFEEAIDKKALPYDEQWDAKFVRVVENGLVNLEATGQRASQRHRHRHPAQHHDHVHDKSRAHDHDHDHKQDHATKAA